MYWMSPPSSWTEGLQNYELYLCYIQCPFVIYYLILVSSSSLIICTTSSSSGLTSVSLGILPASITFSYHIGYNTGSINVFYNNNMCELTPLLKNSIKVENTIGFKNSHSMLADLVTEIKSGPKNTRWTPEYSAKYINCKIVNYPITHHLLWKEA